MNYFIIVIFFCISFALGYETRTLVELTERVVYTPTNFCQDTDTHEAFYSFKDDTDYCFLRGKQYPHRLKGGIIVMP